MRRVHLLVGLIEVLAVSGCFRPTLECNQLPSWPSHTTEVGDRTSLIGIVGEQAVLVPDDGDELNLISGDGQTSSLNIADAKAQDVMGYAIAIGSHDSWAIVGRNKMIVTASGKTATSDSPTRGLYRMDISGLDNSPFVYWPGHWASLSSHTMHTQAHVFWFNDDYSRVRSVLAADLVFAGATSQDEATTCITTEISYYPPEYETRCISWDTVPEKPVTRDVLRDVQVLEQETSMHFPEAVSVVPVSASDVRYASRSTRTLLPISEYRIGDAMSVSVSRCGYWSTDGESFFYAYSADQTMEQVPFSVDPSNSQFFPPIFGQQSVAQLINGAFSFLTP